MKIRITYFVIGVAVGVYYADEIKEYLKIESGKLSKSLDQNDQ